MTDDRTALLAAVCAAPDDDAPRLAFADWLDEHGEAERAEVIREDIRTGWDHWALTTDLPYVMAAKVRRGFIDEIELAAADWLAHHRELAWHPSEEVEVYTEGELTGKFPRPCPPTAQPIRTVRLTTWPDFNLGFDPEIMTGRAAILQRLQEQWPWLTFELPPVSAGVRYDPRHGGTVFGSPPHPPERFIVRGEIPVRNAGESVHITFGQT